MGPIIILDKSAFQSLSRRECFFLHIYFKENLTPILCMEILGDLAKKKHDPKAAKQKVAELAAKFGGSGPVTNLDYRSLCIKSLLGFRFPLDSRIIPDNSTPVRIADRSQSVIIDDSPFNYAILRWAEGNFLEFEHFISKHWRKITRSFSLKSFCDQLDKHHIIIPRVKNTDEILPVTESLLTKTSLQEVWLEWLLDQLLVNNADRSAIKARWRLRHYPLLKDFAPYAWHCIKVLLVALIAIRYHFVKWKSTNILDIQYLYYLPFCMVFVSDDKLHQLLAPLLMRRDQSFVLGRELKSDLRRLADEWDRLTEKKRAMLRYALGSYPPPAKNSIVYELWKRHIRPWKPGMGDLTSKLSEQEKMEAINWVKRMFQEVEGNTY